MVNVIDHMLFLSYIVNGECYQLYVMFILYAKQKFEDTNRVIRSRNWKDRQHNGQ